MATRFCTQCGQQLPENGGFCTNCGTPVPEEPQQAYSQPEPEPQPAPQPEYVQPEVKRQTTMPKPNNYLALSILATIFCCLPFGIPAIIFSAKVDNFWNAGNFQAAEEASRKARNWMLVSVIVGGVAIIAYVALVMFFGLGAAALGAGALEGLY